MTLYVHSGIAKDHALAGNELAETRDARDSGERLSRPGSPARRLPAVGDGDRSEAGQSER